MAWSLSWAPAYCPSQGTPALSRRLAEQMLGSISPGLGALLFLAAIIAAASALLGGLYLLLRNEPMPEKKAPKKIVMSNMK